MPRKFKRSPLALAILALLHEAPMHTYRMQRLIKDRGKDQVINVKQRASLYQMINQLLREELITHWETEEQESFPDRTIYKLTDKGHDTAIRWLREMLSTPSEEFPEFPAAVSLLPLLTPEDAIQQLNMRVAKLTAKIDQINAELASVEGHLPRLFLLESEYMRLMLETELAWVQSIMADLEAGRLAWDQEWSHPFEPPDTNE